MLKNICAIGAILFLSATSTVAAVPKECAADVKAQCGGVQPGAGRIRACIDFAFKGPHPYVPNHFGQGCRDWEGMPWRR